MPVLLHLPNQTLDLILWDCSQGWESTQQFAEATCRDLNLPPGLAGGLASSIQAQVAEQSSALQDLSATHLWLT